jgi:hypothetical protein
MKQKTFTTSDRDETAIDTHQPEMLPAARHERGELDFSPSSVMLHCSLYLYVMSNPDVTHELVREDPEEMG